MALMKSGDCCFDANDPINAGVVSDELVGTGNSEVLRKVTYADVHSGEVLEYITNVMDLKIAPGLIALLYKMRWDVEKSFDEMKNKLRERKAWASSATAKQMQAQLVSLTLNLVLLMEGE
jgi:IS4 transposase